MQKRIIAARVFFLAAVLSGFSAPVIATDADVKLFSQQPIMTAASLSPDGTQLAFLSSLQGRYHVVIERFKPTFNRYILYPGDELDFEWVKWANNDRLIILSSYAAKRDLAAHSSRLHVVETRETRLFSVGSLGHDLMAIIKPGREKETGSRIAKERPPPAYQGNIIDWLPDEPNHILVAVDSDLNAADEVRRVDIRNGKYKNVIGSASRYTQWVSDGKGEVRVGWIIDEQEELSVIARRPGGEFIDLDDHAFVRSGFVPLVFTDDPEIALARGSNAAGRTVVRSVNISTGEFVDTIFEHDQYDAGRILVDELKGVPLGVAFTEHGEQIKYFDTDMQKLQRNIDAALPNKRNQIESTSDNHRQVLILSYSTTGAGSYYIWDRDEKNLSFYEDQYSDMGEGMLAPVEAMSYTARDGLEIPGYLILPRDTVRENLPTIILPHGGPRERDDGSYWFVSHFLASRGYAVFQPNFRGSSGYGRSFADAGRGEWGGKMQDDVTDGAKWLIEQGIADPDRMCIVGWSYGGYAAAMGAIKTPELFKCVASINGVLDLPRIIADDKRTYARAGEWTRHMGLDGESSRSVSPYHQAKSINIPMLIIQSDDDVIVAREQGESMANRLKKLGKTVEYVQIEFGGHSIQNVAGRKKVLEALGSFISEHIG